MSSVPERSTIPPFDPATGNLPLGVHFALWPEVVAHFVDEFFPAEVPVDAAGSQFLDYF